MQGSRQLMVTVVGQSLLSLSLSPAVLVPLAVSWTLIVRVLARFVVARVAYGAVMLLVASMGAIGGLTHVDQTWWCWRGCCRRWVAWPMLPPVVEVC